MSELKLTFWQRRRLERQLTETRDAGLYRRTLALLEFAQGRSVAAIAALLRVSRQSVYNWLEIYTETTRPEALADDERSGRPRRLGDDEEALLRTLLAGSPQGLGYPDVSWTVPLLQEVLYLGTGGWFGERTIRRALERLDYVWKRPRYVLAPDPEREKKTADPAANPGLAAAQCGLGRGRNRSAALPAPARGLGQARRGRQGRTQRSQCPPCHLRSAESAHGPPAVATTLEGS
jgi:transposase